VAANYIIQTEKKEHRAQISGLIGASTGSVKLKLGAKGTSSVPSYDDISQNLLAPLPLSSKNSLISCRSVFQNSDEEEPSNEHNRIIKKTLSRKKAATISDKEELTKKSSKNKPQPLSGTVSVGPINSHQANGARKEARKEAAYATTDMGIGIIGCYNPLTRRYRQHSIDNKQPKKKLLRACNSYNPASHTRNSENKDKVNANSTSSGLGSLGGSRNTITSSNFTRQDSIGLSGYQNHRQKRINSVSNLKYADTNDNNRDRENNRDYLKNRPRHQSFTNISGLSLDRLGRKITQTKENHNKEDKVETIKQKKQLKVLKEPINIEDPEQVSYQFSQPGTSVSLALENCVTSDREIESISNRQVISPQSDTFGTVSIDQGSDITAVSNYSYPVSHSYSKPHSTSIKNSIYSPTKLRRQKISQSVNVKSYNNPGVSRIKNLSVSNYNIFEDQEQKSVKTQSQLNQSLGNVYFPNSNSEMQQSSHSSPNYQNKYTGKNNKSSSSNNTSPSSNSNNSPSYKENLKIENNRLYNTEINIVVSDYKRGMSKLLFGSVGSVAALLVVWKVGPVFCAPREKKCR